MVGSYNDINVLWVFFRFAKGHASEVNYDIHLPLKQQKNNA
jgi:hypothetical protein